MPPTPLTGIRDALLELHTQAREIGEHHVAYHALAAALHADESLQDLDSILEVETRAREHGGWINQHAPTHALSAQSAALRGHHSIFEQLANTAVAARVRIKAEKLTHKNKERP